MQSKYGLKMKREEVIDALNDAYATQNLEEIEYENRVRQALGATSIEDLEQVVFDFPQKIKNNLFPKELSQNTNLPPAAFPGRKRSPSMIHKRGDFEDYSVVLGDKKQAVSAIDENRMRCQAILSSQKMDFRQAQVVGEYFQINVVCTLSETTIDLRNPEFVNKNIDIFISGALGSIKIILPRGGQISESINVVMGNFNTKDKQKSWTTKLKKMMGTEEKVPFGIPFNLNLRGNYWLGDITIEY